MEASYQSLTSVSAQGTKSKLRLKGFHRRTSSEPTPIESWGRHVQQYSS